MVKDDEGRLVVWGGLERMWKFLDEVEVKLKWRRRQGQVQASGGRCDVTTNERGRVVWAATA